MTQHILCSAENSSIMPNYRRVYRPGALYFFTLVTANRRPLFAAQRNLALLSQAVQRCRGEYPFETLAHVIMPEHLHTIWDMPRADVDFSRRWSVIKRTFTQLFLEAGGTEVATTRGQRKARRSGIWQKGFWEHVIRDERDLESHVEYIHYNPVKHGLVRCPHQWRWSSMHRRAALGLLDISWGCDCDGITRPRPDFKALERFVRE